MKHSTDEKKIIAERGSILQTNVGSTVHGTSVGSDDIDRMGMCVEPPEFVIGLGDFQQFIFRTATERTGITNERSQVGDLDLVMYSLRKWVGLALDGNPTVLTPLFVPTSDVIHMNEWGLDLRKVGPSKIISKRSADRFIGYLRGQRERMINGTVGARVNRPELIEKYGFDTKYAGHMVRLGIQGVEVMETGRLTLPMAEPWRTFIVDLREGRHTAEEAMEVAADLEEKIRQLKETSDLPELPDKAWANSWLTTVYQDVWASWC